MFVLGREKRLQYAMDMQADQLESSLSTHVRMYIFSRRRSNIGGTIISLGLRGLDTPGRSLAIFTKKTSFMTFCPAKIISENIQEMSVTKQGLFEKHNKGESEMRNK